MTNVRLSFKTDGETISLDTLINSLSSVKASMKHILGNKVAFDFNHTKIACFEVSMTINDSYEEVDLFEHRNEKTYNDYADSVMDIVTLSSFHTDKNYIKSVKRLLKTISNQTEDVELFFQNDKEDFVKSIYIDNKKAKKAYVELERQLSPPNTELITNTGKITTMSVTKREIGIDCDCLMKEIEFKINEDVKQDIINKRHEIGDTVDFSVEKKPNDKQYKLLYLSNTTKNPTLL